MIEVVISNLFSVILLSALLTLVIMGEIADYFFCNRSVKSLLWEVNRDSKAMKLLEQRAPHLYDDALYSVAPAVNRFLQLEQRLRDLNGQLREAISYFESSMAVIMAHQPELALELSGEIGAVVAAAKRGYRAEEIRRRRIVFEEAQRQKKKIVGVISGGLGVLNFISLVEIMGLSFDRLTPKSLVLMPLGLTFSVSAGIAVHMGLCALINATRNHHVRADKGVMQWNLFPHGWVDVAIWVSILLVPVDALFSSVGLLENLPPAYREERFWRVAILAVSSFASLVNILLAWGISLDRLNYELVIKVEAAKQRALIIALVPDIQKVRVCKQAIYELEREIREVQQALPQSKREAYSAFRGWHKDFRRLLRKDSFMQLNARLYRQGSNKIEPNDVELDREHVRFAEINSSAEDRATVRLSKPHDSRANRPSSTAPRCHR